MGFADRLGDAGDHRDGVVDLVRHLRRERPDRGHLLAVELLAARELDLGLAGDGSCCMRLTERSSAPISSSRVTGSGAPR